MYSLVISSLMKRVLLFLLIFCFTLNNAVAYAAPLPEPIDYLLPQCEGVNEAQLRVELTRVIQEFLDNQTNVNFEDAVHQQWRTLKLDSVIDAEVDRAVLEVNNNAGLVDRFKSSWSPSKAGELANEVTQLAFNSPSLKNGLNQLSKNIADGLADQLEMASAKSSSYAMDCLQQFIGSKYSPIFVNIFGEKIQSADIDPATIGTLKPGTLKYISKHKFGIAGGAILATYITARIRKKVVSTIVDRIFQQVGERILGRFASGFIPFVGEIIGGAFIVSDLIKSFDGALPEIQRALKTPEIKQLIQTEIANTVEKEIRTETSQLSREVSNALYAEWLDFQKDYIEVLRLAKELPRFQAILAKTTNLAKISLLVGLSLNNMGRNQLFESIKDVTFEQALSLPEVSYKILETTHDLSSLIAWTNLAGNDIENVVKLELYKQLSPRDLDHQLLTEILALKDPLTLSKISLLDIASIRQLLSIAKPNLVALAKLLSSEDFQRLAGYLGELTQLERNQLVMFLLNDDPSIIKNVDVMAHIVQSREITTAIKFWEADKNPALLLDATLELISGAVSWHLVADKFGVPVTLFFTIAPIVLLVCLLSVVGSWIYRQLLKIGKPQALVGESNAD